MRNIKLAGRYARALFDFAVEKNQLEESYQDILLIMRYLKTDRELVSVFESPVIPHRKKVKIFTAIFEKMVSSSTFGFLKLILDKRREPALLTISEEFVKIYYRHHNIKIAHLSTAYPVDEQIIQKIKTILEEQTKATIEVVPAVVPDLVGGFVVQIEDFVYDASILKDINILKREFSQNVYKAGF